MSADEIITVSVSEAGRDFAKVARAADENGMAVIMENNKPRYVIVGFDEYENMAAALQMQKAKIDAAAEKIMNENAQALGELAK